MYGVKARVDPPSVTNKFDICNGAELIKRKGVFAWVALQPGFESRWQGTGAIIQIGLTHCDNDAYSDICVPGSIYGFYAVGGCGYRSYGSLGNLGGNPRDLRVESVYVNGTTKFRGYIDNVMKFSLEQNHSHIDCWINEDTMAIWSGETWDGGDSYGSSGGPTDKLFFGSAAYRSINGVFANPGFNATTNCKTGPVDSPGQNHVCDVTYNDDFYLYSVPN